MQDFQNQNSPVEAKSEPNKILLLIGVAIFMIGLITAVYFYRQSSGDTEKLPPKLEGQGSLQGFIRTGEYDFAAWDDQDETYFNDLKTAFLDEGNEPLSLNRGINYLYSNNDATFADILWRIDLSEDKSAVVTYFDPQENKYIMYPENKFYVNADAIRYIEDPATYTVPAQFGFIVILTDYSQAFGLYDTTSAGLNDVVCSKESILPGWNFLSLHETNLEKAILPCISSIEHIFILENQNFKKIYDFDSDPAADKTLSNYLAWVYYSGVPAPAPSPGAEPKEPAQSGEHQFNERSLFLSPSEATVEACTEFKVDIKIDTKGNPTMAADAIISFNPAEVEIMEIIPGTGFQFFPGNQIKNRKIYLTGANISAPYQTGENADLYGSIILKSKSATTETELNFEFEPGITTDSNISNVDGTADLLEIVGNGIYRFEGECI